MSLAPVRCWDLQLHAHNSPCQYERHTFARSSCATFVHARDCWTALAGDSAKEAWTVSIIILTMYSDEYSVLNHQHQQSFLLCCCEIAGAGTCSDGATCPSSSHCSLDIVLVTSCGDILAEVPLSSFPGDTVCATEAQIECPAGHELGAFSSRPPDYRKFDGCPDRKSNVLDLGVWLPARVEVFDQWGLHG